MNEWNAVSQVLEHAVLRIYMNVSGLCNKRTGFPEN